jgi:hypothetical protein
MPREIGMLRFPEKSPHTCHSEGSEDLCASERFLRGESAFSTSHQGAPL